jgi:hypothetical protein
VAIRALRAAFHSINGCAAAAIEGNCSCLRAKVAHMAGHLPIIKFCRHPVITCTGEDMSRTLAFWPRIEYAVVATQMRSKPNED